MALAIALATVSLMSSCKKDLTSNPATSTNTTSEAGKNLERRIQDFYSRMKSIQQSKAANRNAKVTDDVYISVDSAEFLIEATYNYYCASTADDSSDVKYFEFSFVGQIANDSILSESEASAFMQQIKDSIMVQYEAMNYVDKSLNLFDLEIQYSPGTGEPTFEVAYSISTGAWPKPTDTDVPGGMTDVWAVLPLPAVCTTASWTYVAPGYNAYQPGTGITNFGASTTSSVACSTGAATELRRYGINNYKASYPFPHPAKLITSITVHTTGSPSSVSTFPYYTSYGGGGVNTVGYWNFDQYYVTTDVNGGVPSTAAGKNYYAHWLNADMMNFYLDYIPAKIQFYRNSRSFVDFQILLNRNSYTTPGPGFIPLFHIRHDYRYRYGVETTVNKYYPQVSIVDLLTNFP